MAGNLEMVSLNFCGREVGLGGAMVEVEQTAESFFSLDFSRSLFARLHQVIVDPLVVPFCMVIVLSECPERGEGLILALDFLRRNQKVGNLGC